MKSGPKALRLAPKFSHRTHSPPEGAGLKKRFYAFLGDVFLVVVLNEVLLFTYLNFMENYLFQFNNLIAQRIHAKFHAVNILSLMGLFWSYFFLCYFVGGGKTPGKVFFHLKVYCPHNPDKELSLKQCALRASSYLIFYMLGGILLALPFFTTSKKGFPDWISNTNVASDEELEFIKSLELPPPVPKIDDRFPEDPISHSIAS